MNINDIKPVGTGDFGEIYDQFKGMPKEAAEFLTKKKGGDVQGVFHRNEIGDIDLVWGSHDEHQGLEHMIVDHIIDANDFDSVEEMMDVIDDVINNGKPERLNSQDRTTFVKDGYRVSVNKQYRDKNGEPKYKKNWIVTAFDTKRKEYSKKRSEEDADAKRKEIFGEKETSPKGTLTTPPLNPEADGVTLPPSDVSSEGKDTNNIREKQEKSEKSAIQGLENYSEKDITDLVRQHFDDLAADAGVDIVDMKVIGSRTNGKAKEGSDLDVLVEYKGDMKEDDLFNILNDEENKLYIEGIPVDINPITKGKSGTIEEFMKRNADYNKENEDNSLNFREGESQQVEIGAEQRKFTPKQMRERQAFAERQWRRAHEQAEDTVNKLNLTDNVTVVDIADELPDAKKLSERQRKAKGWYDPETGKIVIVMGNHRSPDDVVRTILHEGVAHHGLRKLFGNNFDTFLDNVHDSATTDVTRQISELADSKYGGDTRKATEEYLARLAEDTDFERANKQGWWQKIKNYFLDMLKELGLPGYDKKLIDLSDNELRYILWRSYENLAEPGRYKKLYDEEAERQKPFHDMIDDMFGNPDFDKATHSRERYDLGDTPEFMKKLGITGDNFSLSFKNIKSHLGKDSDHNLTAKEWHELPDAIKRPFLITSYGDGDGKFRLYTSVKVGNKFAVVGIDVVKTNQGKDKPLLDVNRIKTVFGRDRYVMDNGEKILAYDEKMTPEQEALLRGHNFREYPSIQELSSGGKGTKNNDTLQENQQENAENREKSQKK